MTYQYFTESANLKKLGRRPMHIEKQGRVPCTRPTLQRGCGGVPCVGGFGGLAPQEKAGLARSAINRGPAPYSFRL